MYKEFALQDAGMLVGTQQGLASRAVGDDFPLNDQEILVRHFHQTVADWVADHRAEV
ncbi:SRPBCC family protein [Actinomadura adrarensis]|uniref:SRPBCC family protein n=1 Tax=Actinomadura adrarensis TaxID=1819600 RepID=A0ABW3CC60_9ACTN